MKGLEVLLRLSGLSSEVEVICLQSLHEISAWLHFPCIGRMSKLLSVSRLCLESGIVSADTEVTGVRLCRVL